ncbi:Uma2 family endonuclease [Fulvimarina sp. 2208YS6-2-32]|uniref:Uma2 family endonuclease n=1 Tax=Fulvimarina uroteuthidis TaxID=3098149 RepID=A0ABU5I772_9HYPH|nr:Uma2 family endonuclease [Fulvimarina sp. 2208YS6-2-32]MDY8110648.1 Uma2 family endonuclease [Fulvimarina sp. 2208YS6-2-32]
MSALADTHPPDAVPRNLTIDAFFDWIELREERYELVDGTPVMMPFVKRSHARVVSNIDRTLQQQLDPDRYLVTQGDFAIRTGVRSIRYADVLVEAASDDLDGRTTDTPKLIFEVLSDMTTANDFGPKKLEYMSLSTLDATLILRQDKACVWLWERDGEGNWPDQPRIVETGAIELSRLAVTLPIDAIYRGIVR